MEQRAPATASCQAWSFPSSLHLGHLGLSNTLTDPSHNPYLGLAVPILRTNDVQRSQEFLCQKLQMEVGAVGSNSSQGTIYHNLLDHPWGRNPSPAWKFHPRAAPSTPNQPGGGLCLVMPEGRLAVCTSWVLDVCVRVEGTHQNPQIGLQDSLRRQAGRSPAAHEPQHATMHPCLPSHKGQCSSWGLCGSLQPSPRSPCPPLISVWFSPNTTISIPHCLIDWEVNNLVK